MLELSNIGKHYEVSGNRVAALFGIDLKLAKGSFTTVVGRSGCGKTTLLRILAGLISPDTGEILIHGPAPRIGVVFQEARLMPWLDVSRNIAFGLHRHLDRKSIERKVSALLEVTGLGAFANAMPTQLSGGMAQRVALARALVMQPDLLLMDEPFAALDAFTRRSMQNELVGLWQQKQPTIVFVTHDVEEAVLLGETVIELSAGTIVGRKDIDIPYPRDPTGMDEAGCRRAILDRLLNPA
ncbi:MULTISPECIES: ABC transporter ATP-binding protein [Alphaproteobacteria]|uniref:Nitrate ABC transporter ATP-binding protein n=2 Tax=Alphaproteobacteria TaxID=28211 RepID=A0A512HPG9_9HYPH|nr:MULTISPECIES: ABC transporter ATP-binding protein [Alphaproteobacteria]GEO87352.1 nitrate ABC transporter ATP-binding protein [Ciceribacter naphthalenivorans]GLR24038.1 nitrate ABC transporter ATP-binding protein [Ciceribacter naphthalenivorans]GLT06894.1 nitrate ABC transporter ATP-binding protein [Sphingomonas psychrolutea]